MADALDSKSSGRKVVWVQVPPPVLLCAARDCGFFMRQESPARIRDLAECLTTRTRLRRMGLVDFDRRSRGCSPNSLHRQRLLSEACRCSQGRCLVNFPLSHPSEPSRRIAPAASAGHCLTWESRDGGGR